MERQSGVARWDLRSAVAEHGQRDHLGVARGCVLQVLDRDVAVRATYAPPRSFGADVRGLSLCSSLAVYGAGCTFAFISRRSSSSRQVFWRQPRTRRQLGRRLATASCSTSFVSLCDRDATRFCWTSFASLNVCHCEATARSPDDFDYRPQGAPVCLRQLGTATLIEFSERELARYSSSKVGNFRDEYPL